MIIVQLIVVLLILVQQSHPFLLLTTHEYSRNTPEMLLDMESASSFLDETRRSSNIEFILDSRVT